MQTLLPCDKKNTHTHNQNIPVTKNLAIYRQPQKKCERTKVKVAYNLTEMGDIYIYVVRCTDDLV